MVNQCNYVFEYIFIVTSSSALISKVIRGCFTRKCSENVHKICKEISVLEVVTLLRNFPEHPFQGTSVNSSCCKKLNETFLGSLMEDSSQNKRGTWNTSVNQCNGGLTIVEGRRNNRHHPK